MHSGDILLFSLSSGQTFANAVATALGIEPAAHEERDFEDGEHKIRPLVSVRNRDVYIVQSLYGDQDLSVNDKLIRLLFFIGAIRDAGAARVNAIIPYLCYARKDRRTKSRDPLSVRYLAQLFDAIHVDTMTVLDVHNVAAFENAFRCPCIHLTAGSLFADYFVDRLGDRAISVASPDIGGVKRAEAFRELLSPRLGTEAGGALMEKRRSEGVVSGDLVAGDIDGRTILILDDLIAGGTTMVRAADAFLAKGATEVYAVATHGAFGANANEKLATDSLKQIVISNSIDHRHMPSSPPEEKLKELNAAPLIAEAIKHLHDGAQVESQPPSKSPA